MEPVFADVMKCNAATFGDPQIDHYTSTLVFVFGVH